MDHFLLYEAAVAAGGSAPGGLPFLLLILILIVVGAYVFAKRLQLSVGKVLLAVFGGIAGVLALLFIAGRVYAFTTRNRYAAGNGAVMISRSSGGRSSPLILLLILAVAVALILLGIKAVRYLQNSGYNVGMLALITLGGLLLLAAVIAIILFVKNNHTNAVNYIYLRRY